MNKSYAPDLHKLSGEYCSGHLIVSSLIWFMAIWSLEMLCDSCEDMFREHFLIEGDYTIYKTYHLTSRTLQKAALNCYVCSRLRKCMSNMNS